MESIKTADRFLIHNMLHINHLFITVSCHKCHKTYACAYNACDTVRVARLAQHNLPKGQTAVKCFYTRDVKSFCVSMMNIYCPKGKWGWCNISDLASKTEKNTSFVQSAEILRDYLDSNLYIWFQTHRLLSIPRAGPRVSESWSPSQPDWGQTESGVGLNRTDNSTIS